MRLFIYLFMFAGTITLLSCGFDNSKSKDSESTSEESSGNPFADAMKQINEATGGGEVREPVNFREFKKGFPESVRGYDMQDFGGSTNTTMGFSFSQAEARYVSGDKQIEVEVIDAAGVGLLIKSMAAWSITSIDREDKNGLARTGKIMGYRSYEEYDKNRNSSSIALIIADRVILNVKANDMDLDELKKFVERFDPGDLEKVVS
jgi:hypothetical protein